MEDVCLTLFIPSMVNGQPIVAKVPGFETENINMVGEQPELRIDMTPRDFRFGRFFTPEENDRVAHVAVIGSNLSDALFPDGRPLGRTVHRGRRGVHGDRTFWPKPRAASSGRTAWIPR